MIKIISLIFVSILSISLNAKNEIKSSSIAITATVSAAALYDYYFNNADVIRSAAEIAEKYSKISFEKTKSGIERVATLVKENPIVAIASISGAAALVVSGIYIIDKNKETKEDKNKEIKIETKINEDNIGLIKLSTLNLSKRDQKKLKKYEYVKDLPKTTSTYVLNRVKTAIDERNQ